jgi:rod shape-determining protein MreD
MTRQDLVIKWLAYVLALLPILVLDLFVLPWIPFWGALPCLLPVAAVTVAVLEGPAAGAGYGLFVGVLSDALIPGLPGAMTLGLTLLGLCAGAVARYRVRQNFLGCLVCSAGALAVIDLFRVLSALLQRRAGLLPLLRLALPEIVWSLVFLPLIYAIYLWVFHRVPKPSVLT